MSNCNDYFEINNDLFESDLTNTFGEEFIESYENISSDYEEELDENVVTDVLKGFGTRTVAEPFMISHLIKNNGIKDSLDILLRKYPTKIITEPKNAFNIMKDSNNFVDSNSVKNAATAAELALGLARPAVPLAAGAYGVSQALDDDSILDTIKNKI